MEFPKGSAIALGIVVGVVLGVLTDNLASFVCLGLMFGIIGDMASQNQKK